MLADAEAVKLLASVSGYRLPCGSIVFAQGISDLDELAGDALRLGMFVGEAFREYVPDGDEQFASDGDDGFVATEAGFQAGKFSLPVRVSAHRCLGSFDQGKAQTRISRTSGQPLHLYSLIV